MTPDSFMLQLAQFLLQVLKKVIHGVTKINILGVT